MLTAAAGSRSANTYNGDGTLVAQTANGVQTRFTQDLVSPLSQLLQTTQGTTTNHYVYGHERLYEQAGIVRTWYGGDALGSVRQTLDDTGSPLSALNYDPWGTPEGNVTPPVFGFTGEWQDTGVGLVNLRARWYAPGQGRFTARDPFAGFDEQPYSLHPYQYGYSNPILLTDPSGNCITEISREVCYVQEKGFLHRIARAVTGEHPFESLVTIFGKDPERTGFFKPYDPDTVAVLRPLITQHEPWCDVDVLLNLITLQHNNWLWDNPEYVPSPFEHFRLTGFALLSSGADDKVASEDHFQAKPSDASIRRPIGTQNRETAWAAKTGRAYDRRVRRFWQQYEGKMIGDWKVLYVNRRLAQRVQPDLVLVNDTTKTILIHDPTSKQAKGHVGKGQRYQQHFASSHPGYTIQYTEGHWRGLGDWWEALDSNRNLYLPGQTKPR